MPNLKHYLKKTLARVFSENFAIFLSTPFYVYEQLLLIFQEVLYFRLVQNRRKFYLFKGLFI